MKIGFDIDGVFANFVPAYQNLFVKLTGKDLFAPGDDEDPPCWDWPEMRGYTAAEAELVWTHIKRSTRFWRDLEPDWMNVQALGRMEVPHDYYFVTSRPGDQALWQTMGWMREYTPFGFCPVLVVGHREKGHVCRALQLDAYIDDHGPNVVDCLAQSLNTRTYLLGRRYNREYDVPRRVATVEEFLRLEGLYFD